jgi:hypothetical protein
LVDKRLALFLESKQTEGRATFAQQLLGEGLHAGMGRRTVANKTEGQGLPGRFFCDRRPRVTFSRQERQALESLESVVQPVSSRFLVHISDTNTNVLNFVSTDLTFLDPNSIDLFISPMDTTDERGRNSEIDQIKIQ